MEYSTDKSKASLVKEFKELLRKAYNEHKKSLTALMEEHTNIYIEEDVADEILSNVNDQIDSEISDRINSVEMSANRLRELRGILNAKGNSGEAKLKALNIEIEHWKREAAKTGGAKSKLYETIKEVSELKADQIRLNLNQQPETKVVKGIVENKTENSVLLKFKGFKRWTRENIIGISAVAISVAGVITTVVIGAKNAAKKGGRMTGIVKIFSTQYDAFLNELVQLFPYKFELQLLKACPYSYERILEEGSKHISEHVELIISNRDVDGLVSLIPENYKPTVRSLVNELDEKTTGMLWDWIDLFVKIFKKYTIINK